MGGAISTGTPFEPKVDPPMGSQNVRISSGKARILEPRLWVGAISTGTLFEPRVDPPPPLWKAKM